MVIRGSLSGCEDPNPSDTLTLPVGNYVSAALGNYVSENPSDLGNFMIADKPARSSCPRVRRGSRVKSSSMRSTGTEAGSRTR